MTRLADGVAPFNPFVIAEIRAWMGRRGVNQTGLAVLTGTNVDWVSRRLKGRQVLDLDDVALIAHALEVDPRELLVTAASARAEAS